MSEANVVVIVEPPPPETQVSVEPPPPEIQVTLSEVALAGPEGKAATQGQLDATVEAAVDVAIKVHIDAENPHPAYDDGPSFLLLYMNAKV